MTVGSRDSRKPHSALSPQAACLAGRVENADPAGRLTRGRDVGARCGAVLRHRSAELQIGRSLLSTFCDHVERDLLAVIQGADPCRLQSSDVHEHVLAAVLRLNEGLSQVWGCSGQLVIFAFVLWLRVDAWLGC